ncbi:TPA: hypothetical protein ACKJ5D_002071, partial [Neisseria gonorrhoeae]
MQADLAYAYEHITRDYPDAAGLEKGKKISTVSDYFRNRCSRSRKRQKNKHGKRLFQKHPY